MKELFKIENGMRVANLENIEEHIKSTRKLVEEVIAKYNSDPENKERLAIRGGTRRPRDPDEQRVLDSFKLK